MYKALFSTDQQQSTMLKYLENSNNLIIVKANKISQTSISLAQKNLLIEFAIHENAEDNLVNNWVAIQQRLRQIFEQVVEVDHIPNCILKVHVFVLNIQPDKVQSTIINACWLCLLKHGAPMKKSIWSYEWKDKLNKQNRCLLDLNNFASIVAADYYQQIPAEMEVKAGQYKQFVKETIKSFYSQ